MHGGIIIEVKNMALLIAVRMFNILWNVVGMLWSHVLLHHFH
jgi:hypothetical protein